MHNVQNIVSKSPEGAVLRYDNIANVGEVLVFEFEECREAYGNYVMPIGWTDSGTIHEFIGEDRVLTKRFWGRK